MDIDKLTLGELKQIASMVHGGSSGHNPYPIGSCMLIRTVTMIDVGRVVEVGPQEIVLEDASWIADTGRFHECLRDGTLNEVEPWPDGRVVVGRGAVVDAAAWNHPLPREAK